MEASAARWPDFLQIGAAKAGTTALFHAISRHPRVHTPAMKEPRYLCHPDAPPRFNGPGAERINHRIVSSRAAYLALYADCPAASITGDFSNQYLAHPDAPATASRLIPDARLIAILRHPVDRAYSNYLHERRAGREPLRSFEEAWHDDERRRANGWSPFSWYVDQGFYARHLRRWLACFPREQMLILFYEDWQQRPQDVLAQIWRHLGLAPVAHPVITRENTSLEPRWAWLHQRLRGNDNPLRRLARRTLPLWVRDAITRAEVALNSTKVPRLDPALRERLARVYHEDLTTLEALTGRDLTSWRR